MSPKTIKAYRIDLKQFEEFLYRGFDDREIHETDRIELRIYLKNISENNKPKTVKRKMATLKAFFNYLEFEDIIAVNPFRKLRIRIKENKELPKTIPLSIIERIFSHLYNQKKHIKDNNKNYSYNDKVIIRDIAVIELLFATGVRVAELCNLKKNNIDFLKTNANIKIVGKGGRERIIPICSSETIQALIRYYNLFQCELFDSDFFL